MSKSKIISLIIFVLIIIGIGLYFVFFNQKSNQSEIKEEDLLNFNNKDESLPKATLEKYFQEFTWAKNHILNNTATFNTSDWLTIARLKKYLKDYGGAEQIYLFIISRDKNNYTPEVNLADLYGNYLNNWQASAEHYWAAITKTGNNKDAALLFYRNLADIYATKLSAEKREFETKIEAAITKDYSQSVDFLTMMAKYYKDTGNKEKAIEYLQKALGLNPPNADLIRLEIEEIKK